MLRGNILLSTIISNANQIIRFFLFYRRKQWLFFSIHSPPSTKKHICDLPSRHDGKLQMDRQRENIHSLFSLPSLNTWQLRALAHTHTSMYTSTHTKYSVMTWIFLCSSSSTSSSQKKRLKHRHYCGKFPSLLWCVCLFTTKCEHRYKCITKTPACGL